MRWKGRAIHRGGTFDQAIGRSKGGLTTKIVALTDALSQRMRFRLLPGHRYDTIAVAKLLEGVAFGALIGDQAYDADWIIEEVRERGAEVVIEPHKCRASLLSSAFIPANPYEICVKSQKPSCGNHDAEDV